MKKLLFVYNPRSGKEKIKNHLSDILECFARHGYELEVHPTMRALDAKEYVETNAHRFDIVVCSGGDGTLSEVVSGLMGYADRPKVGYIPAGSTNDFGVSLNLPKIMKNAAQVCMTGTPFMVDIGSMNDRYFTYAAGFGALTEVSYMTPQQKKNVLGHQAYILEGIKNLSSLTAYNIRLEHDGEVIEGRYIYGMISNSYSIAGFKGLTGKAVKLNDGLFEVTLIRVPNSVTDYQEILSVGIGMEESNDCFTYFKTTNLKIHSTEEIPWVLDGEFGGNHKEVTIEINRKAIEIMSGLPAKQIKSDKN